MLLRVQVDFSDEQRLYLTPELVKGQVSGIKTLLLTTLALLAFAANSVLCRMALGEAAIDAPSFTVIRLFSGALTLFVLIRLKTDALSRSSAGSWISASMLFLYALTFSYAYLTLDTATGALILFGAVQISMILLSMRAGNRLSLVEWVGVLLAFGGFVYLVLPGVSAPSPLGFFLMSLSGVAWGVYTLRGRASGNPLLETCSNFLRTLPFIVVVLLLTIMHAQLSWQGVLLAVLSGAVASGLGYAVWYQALAGLSATQAAVVQLLVPVIAAFGGVLFIGETIGLRLMVSAAMVLGGILLVVLARFSFRQPF